MILTRSQWKYKDKFYGNISMGKKEKVVYGYCYGEARFGFGSFMLFEFGTIKAGIRQEHYPCKCCPPLY